MLCQNGRLCRDSPRTQQTYSIRLLVIFEPAFCLVTNEYMCVTHENRKCLTLLAHSLEGKKQGSVLPKYQKLFRHSAEKAQLSRYANCDIDFQLHETSLNVSKK